jgi:hypothetical protein
MRSAAALAPLVALIAAVTGVALFALSRPVEPPRKVKLAVLVVFDQLRGDYLEQWQPLFRDDGFARLQRDGAWFANCHYPYAVTTTGPGHASMLTGAAPDKHGIINNNWREGDASVYCAGHTRYQLVPPPPSFPPDPSEKKAEKKDAKPKPGAVGTPERLLSETVADVLKESTGGRAKVFGLSLKDRSAILPTGKRPDGAYWFYGAFGTSTYYADTVHPWVADFNRSRRATRWFGHDWTRLRPDLDYDKWSGRDDAFGEGGGNGQGTVFPHPTTGGKPRIGREYFEALANSPFGNDLLLELTKACVTAEKLGSHDVPDLLVVSFSSNDLIGHTWGPDSHEVLDATLRSDALMADLLAFLDRTVGKDQYLLGLTADHGVCPLPEVAQTKGLAPFAARVEAGDLEKALNEHLTAAYPATRPADGKSARWVDGLVFPWVYLKPELVKAVGKPREAIAAEAARFLATQNQNAVARTFTRTELSGPVSPSDEIAVRVKRSFHPARSGDVCVVLQPYCIESPRLGKGTTHGAPYAYDTHVPLLVYGPGIRGGKRDEPTTPQALASIFAKMLDIRRPKDASFPIPETLE